MLPVRGKPNGKVTYTVSVTFYESVSNYQDHPANCGRDHQTKPDIYKVCQSDRDNIHAEKEAKASGKRIDWFCHSESCLLISTYSSYDNNP